MNATQFQHTPGPWKRARRIAGGYTIKARNFWPAVVLGDGRQNRGTAIANARLIAAAPELLVALRKCADRLGDMDCGAELDEARDAIAKATGR
jgi:hypothetical protein